MDSAARYLLSKRITRIILDKYYSSHRRPIHCSIIDGRLIVRISAAATTTTTTNYDIEEVIGGVAVRSNRRWLHSIPAGVRRQLIKTPKTKSARAEVLWKKCRPIGCARLPRYRSNTKPAETKKNPTTTTTTREKTSRPIDKRPNQYSTIRRWTWAEHRRTRRTRMSNGDSSSNSNSRNYHHHPPEPRRYHHHSACRRLVWSPRVKKWIRRVWVSI